MGKRTVKPPKKRKVKHYRWQHVQTDHPMEKAFIESLSQGLEQAQTVFQLMNQVNHWLQVASDIDQRVRGKIIVPQPLIHQSDESH